MVAQDLALIQVGVLQQALDKMLAVLVFRLAVVVEVLQNNVPGVVVQAVAVVLCAQGAATGTANYWWSVSSWRPLLMRKPIAGMAVRWC
jgi:hypothetical protein